MTKAAVAGCLLFSLFGCTSMAAQRTDAVAVDVPTAWSGAIASTGLEASWELDIFGANRSAVAASKATARASAANLGEPTRVAPFTRPFPIRSTPPHR